ncbi:hypothetical protein CR513_21054, partial [Mucuna pruriens]
MCKRKRGCRELRLKVIILLRPLRIRKERTLRMLRKGLLNERKLGVERAKDVLELIHTGICGPFPTASWNRQQYFITFIDDYSRYDYLYLIHEKSQSLDVFKSFKIEVELQLGKKIKAVKSDHDGEYYGIYDGSGEQRPRPFALFLRECGIVLQYTMPDKPSMNGVAKPQNWTLKDMVRKSVNDIGQVLVPITVQETTLVIGDNVQTIVPNIIPEQDYDEVLPQIPIEQPQQPQEVSLRRSIRERRHAILDDYIVFLQEHEDDIGLTKDDPINFCQAMQSSNSQKWIDVMKDELKSMQDNDILRDRSQSILRLSQENYISKVLKRFDMKDSKPGDAPIAKGNKFSLKQCPNNDIEGNEMQKIPYASAVGSLMYLSDLGMQYWKK